MKEFVLYTGCTAPVRMPSYEASVKIVLEKLGVRVVDMDDANCCGAQYVESTNRTAFSAMSGRILAIAEKMGKDIVAICGACSGSIKTAQYEMDHDSELKKDVNAILGEEGLEYTGNVRVRHLLQVFHEDIGYDAIKAAIVRPYHGIRLAAHYGCHVTRPYEIVKVDDPQNPTIIDRIIEIAGGMAVDYTGKTRCCGGPLLAMDEEVANKIGLDKIHHIQQQKVDGLITACVFCDIQLTSVQFEEDMHPAERIPVLTLPQFLGPALGIDEDVLGISLNKISPDGILETLEAR
ncbi:MAG: CoB--CoM heterodisulfide reductase iron-sulfur subunit B family protein [Candidatus Thorarchaeota archaeon]